MSARDWFEQAVGGAPPELRPWERLELLELVCEEPDDHAAIAALMLAEPLPAFKLNPLVLIAADASNAGVTAALITAGAECPPLERVCHAGFADVARLCIEAGARLNRRYANALAPIHLAAASGDVELVAVLAEAGCDLTVRTPDGRTPSELAAEPVAKLLSSKIGSVGFSWFRDAQKQGGDHYMLYDEGEMLGFNPNDVQTPMLTGDEAEGFGWPNTPQQAHDWLDQRRLVRMEIEWFLPLLDKLVAGEDFSLDAMGPRVPRRR